MSPEPKPIQTLLLQIFLPAVLLVATALAVFAYKWHETTIIDGFDRKLITTSALTGAMIDPQDHDGLIAAAFAGADPDTTEATPEYRRNGGPIERIQQRLKLTYLYTQAFGGEQDIVYVLDGTVGEEHSPIGSPDDLTAETRAGLEDSEANGSVFVSPVEYQEQWGLLKTAAAPVYGSAGEITSTAGADVNISVILVATQNALFASTLIGIGSIIACLLIALTIMRLVARPIEALKDQALRIAAGQSAAADEGRAPREVAELSGALTRMADTYAMDAEMQVQSDDARELAANIRVLSADSSASKDTPILLVEDGTELVFWVPAGADDLDTVMTGLATQALAQRFAEQPELARHWRVLADRHEGVCLSLYRVAGTIETLGNSPVQIVRGGNAIALGEGKPAAFDPRRDRISVAGRPAIALAGGGQP